MRIPFSAITALTCAIGCGGVTNVDDLFDPNPTNHTGGSGGASGASGAAGASGSTGGKGGSGGAGGTGGMSTGGTGGTGGGVGGTGGASGGGTGGVAGTGGTGGMIDAGADVRRDGTTDVRVDGSGKAGVRCGAMTCDPAMTFCCLTSGNNRCLTSTVTCSLQSDRLNCDDTADCPLGQVCCVTEGMSGNGAAALCTASTSCIAPRQMLCDPAAATPCVGIGLVCSANGSGIIQDYAYCHAP